MATKAISKSNSQDLRKAEFTFGDPANTTDLIYGNFSQGGLFSLCVGDVISEVAVGGSPLMAWLPTRGVLERFEHVAHLEYIMPDGFDGSLSYMDYLAAQEAIGDCEYGPGTDYNICEYTHTMHRFSMSNKDKPLKLENWGLRQCDQSPQYRLRGDSVGIAIDNDADWAVARLGIGMEQHLNWNLLHGDPSVASATGMYDGLNNIITTGWVGDHKVGPGACTWTDPIVLSGTGLSSVEELLRMIRATVRKIRLRAIQRGYRLQAGDMAVVMPALMWTYVADAIACGALTGYCTTSALSLTTAGDFSRERSRITQGFYGFGFIDIDGTPVGIMHDDNLGSNGNLTDEFETPTITGDILILTRRFRGISILEHQFLDFNRLLAAAPNQVSRDSTTMQNGLLRTTWVNLNNACYYYAIEGYGRIVSRMQPLQARINDVTVETILANENESASFASPDFYPYAGQRGGQGAALISGV